MPEATFEAMPWIDMTLTALVDFSNHDNPDVRCDHLAEAYQNKCGLDGGVFSIWGPNWVKFRAIAGRIVRISDEARDPDLAERRDIAQILRDIHLVVMDIRDKVGNASWRSFETNIHDWRQIGELVRKAIGNMDGRHAEASFDWLSMTAFGALSKHPELVPEPVLSDMRARATGFSSLFLAELIRSETELGYPLSLPRMPPPEKRAEILAMLADASERAKNGYLTSPATQQQAWNAVGSRIDRLTALATGLFDLAQSPSAAKMNEGDLAC